MILNTLFTFGDNLFFFHLSYSIFITIYVFLKDVNNDDRINLSTFITMLIDTCTSNAYNNLHV